MTKVPPKDCNSPNFPLVYLSAFSKTWSREKFSRNLQAKRLVKPQGPIMSVGDRVLLAFISLSSFFFFYLQRLADGPEPPDPKRRKFSPM